MKVIAKIDINRVLCEVSMDELAFLNGFQSPFSNGFNREHASKVNAECDLTKMVNTSKFVRSLRSKTIESTKHALEQAIELHKLLKGI